MGGERNLTPGGAFENGAKVSWSLLSPEHWEVPEEQRKTRHWSIGKDMLTSSFCLWDPPRRQQLTLRHEKERMGSFFF